MLSEETTSAKTLSGDVFGTLEKLQEGPCDLRGVSEQEGVAS